VINTDDGLGHRWGMNGEFCVAVGPSHRDSWHTGLNRLQALAV